MSSKGLPIEQHLKFAGTTVGRDKVYRLVQYFSRFLAYYLAQRGGYDKATIARFQSLKSSIGLSRKLMRVGKPVEHLQTLLKAFSLRDDFVRLCAIGRAASLGVYLSFDMLQWIHGAGVYQFQNIRSIAQKAARFWLIGLAFSWLSGLYKLRQLALRSSISRRAIRAQGGLALASTDLLREKRDIETQRASVQRQLLQDSLDILIPATTLGYTGFSEGTVGLVGSVTSIMGARSQWKKVATK